MSSGEPQSFHGVGQLNDLTLALTRLGLSAADLGSAMTPVLKTLVAHTVAVGAGYFQLSEQSLHYHARATSGEMPQGPLIEELLVHGLSADLPLIQQLYAANEALFFEDIALALAEAGFPELGVRALMAAPIHDREGRLVGALLAYSFAPHDWTANERSLIGSITGLLALLAARLDAEERERAAHESALRALGLCLEARDAETQGHTDRVTALVVKLGQKLGLSESDLRALRWGAYLHDIGKMGIPDAVLHYPGKLCPESWRQMQGHVEGGLKLAGQLSFLPPAAMAVIAGHHERWDGTGYPCGHRGEDIALPARIFAVCDVYDALLHVRPYKRAWSQQETLDYIRDNCGSHFDPRVVEVLFEVLEDAGLSTSNHTVELG